MNYYVYYKAGPEEVDGLRIAVQRLFDLVETRFAVRGRWMRRRDDPSTYMEVYEGVQDAAAFEALMAHEGAKLGVPRKLEVFTCA